MTLRPLRRLARWVQVEVVRTQTYSGIPKIDLRAVHVSACVCVCGREVIKVRPLKSQLGRETIREVKNHNLPVCQAGRIGENERRL